MYDAAFYDEVVNEGSTRSARVVVPRVLDLMGGPCRVVDVGCGEGAWLAEFARLGCDVTGVDGAHVQPERLLIPPERFVARDLACDRLGLGPFDLAVSLEVGEHIAEHRADVFVDLLCEAADTILFSAAFPGQGGVGHVNEQPPSYWAERFVTRGFAVSGGLRWEFWDDDRVEPYYRSNLLFVSRRPGSCLDLFSSDAHNEPMWVVHPLTFTHVRHALGGR